MRVSSGSQDASTQVTTLKRYAADRDIKIVKTVTLQGYGASKGIEHGRWRLILVTDSSRLDRREDLDAQAEILLAIRQAGGDVISVSEPQFGKTDFAGRIVTLVAQHANAEKSRTVKEQTWRGVQAIMANRAFYGPHPLFWQTTGERYGKRAFCADARSVRSVYRSMRDGESQSSLARRHHTYPQSIRRLTKLDGLQAVRDSGQGVASYSVGAAVVPLAVSLALGPTLVKASGAATRHARYARPPPRRRQLPPPG